MSNIKWTPGEWVVADTCSNYEFNVVRIGSIHINVGNQANAHLIASAPYLYASLSNLVAWADGPRNDALNDLEVARKALANARKALAKARGEL